MAAGRIGRCHSSAAAAHVPKVSRPACGAVLARRYVLIDDDVSQTIHLRERDFIYVPNVHIDKVMVLVQFSTK
jgi:hypothetical protein